MRAIAGSKESHAAMAACAADARAPRRGVKPVCVFLLAACLLALPCLAAAQESLAGVWRLAGLLTDGFVFRASALGVSGTITLNADGSSRLSLLYNGENTEYDAAWEASGDAVRVGDKQLYYEDGSLLMENGQVKMLYLRSGAGAADWESTFYTLAGEWTLDELISGGVSHPPADFGVSGSLLLNAAGVLRETYASKEEGGWENDNPWGVSGGVILSNGETYRVEGDSLVYGEDDWRMVYRRSEGNARLSIEAFALAGEWIMPGAAYRGSDADAGISDIQASLRLNADGTARLFSRLPQDTAYRYTDCAWFFSQDLLCLDNGMVLRYEDGALLTETDASALRLQRRAYPADTARSAGIR